MGLFGKKKFSALDALPAEDQWAVGQGENDGKPLIARVSSSAKEYAGHPELPVRLGMAIPLHAPRPDGLPDEAESEQLDDIEDRLFDAVGSDGRVVLVITTSGMREFVSYVRSPDVAERVAQSGAGCDEYARGPALRGGRSGMGRVRPVCVTRRRSRRERAAMTT